MILVDCFNTIPIASNITKDAGEHGRKCFVLKATSFALAAIKSKSPCAEEITMGGWRYDFHHREARTVRILLRPRCINIASLADFTRLPGCDSWDFSAIDPHYFREMMESHFGPWNPTQRNVVSANVQITVQNRNFSSRCCNICIRNEKTIFQVHLYFVWRNTYSSWTRSCTLIWNL